MNSPVVQTRTSRSRSTGKIVPTLLKCAFEALVQTWLILLLGSIALNLVASIAGPMIPSAPPGFAHRALAEADGSFQSLWDSSWFTIKVNRFWLLFGVIFALTSWVRLGNVPRRTRKILRRVSDDWFSLIIANAFWAMGAAMALVWAQYSLEHWVLKEVLGWFQAGLQHFIQAIFGQRQWDALQRWWNWYDANQLKFAFWLLYIGNTCDDLGLPNFKTLGRKILRRIRARRQPPQPAADPAAATGPQPIRPENKTG